MGETHISESAAEDRISQTATNKSHLLSDRMSKISQGHLQQTSKIPVL